LLVYTEPGTPRHNLAEGAIRELKRAYRRLATKVQSPSRLWDDCFELLALQRNHTASAIYSLMGQVPETVVSGLTPDISNLAEFGWYDPVWYVNYKQDEDFKRVHLGRYLGPSFEYGQELCYKVLNWFGKVLHRSSVYSLTDDDKRNPAVTEKLVALDAEIARLLVRNEADAMDPFEGEEFETPQFETYGEFLENGDEVDEPSMPEADQWDHDAFDKYIGAELLLPRDGVLSKGRVRARKRDADGHLIGCSNAQPALDTSVYEVEFPDGCVDAFAANVIAENLYAQVDGDGNLFTMPTGIVDHRSDGDALRVADLDAKGRVPRTTKGWSLCVEWEDGSTSWVPLRDLKESNPIELAEYAVARGIDREPAFAWWVPYTLRKREWMVSMAKARLVRKTHKFGIELPRSVRHALELDRANGNTLWADAMRKEQAGIRPAFDFKPKGEARPVGYERIEGHNIFDVCILTPLFFDTVFSGQSLSQCLRYLLCWQSLILWRRHSSPAQESCASSDNSV
jgi:hypothetical protein